MTGASGEQILAKLPRDLSESCIIPIRSGVYQPNEKSPTICHGFQTRSGDGAQIPLTVEKDLVSFHKHATVLKKKSFGQISESDWVNDLRRALLMLLKEFGSSLRRR